MWGIQRGGRHTIVYLKKNHRSIIKDQGNLNKSKTVEREDVFGCLGPIDSRVCEKELPAGHTYAGLMHCDSHTRYSN